MKLIAKGSLAQVNSFAQFVESLLRQEGGSISTQTTKQTPFAGYSVELVIEDFDFTSLPTGSEPPQTT
jgi:hypothetical protein